MGFRQNATKKPKAQLPLHESSKSLILIALNCFKMWNPTCGLAFSGFRGRNRRLQAIIGEQIHACIIFDISIFRTQTTGLRMLETAKVKAEIHVRCETVGIGWGLRVLERLRYPANEAQDGLSFWVGRKGSVLSK